MEQTSLKTVPQFISGSKGQLFAMNIVPPQSAKAHVIFLPSIGEELNRCRKMVADQARMLAGIGYSCWVVDYYGTGDSDGDFSDIDWNLWLADLHAFCENELGNDLPITFFGIRIGALLALEYLSRHACQNKDSAVLFQPVTSGKKYVTQMFRQRSAMLVANELPAESTSDMWEMVQRGECLDIGGYKFNSSILVSMEKLSIQNYKDIKTSRLVWIENVKEKDDAIAIGSGRAVEALRSGGNVVTTKTFCDPPIWQLHKKAEMKDNLMAVRAIFGKAYE